MKTKKLVVSTYNWDLEWLKMTYDYGFSPDNTVIYDKSDGTKVVYDVNHKDSLTYEKDDTKMDLSHLGEVIPSRNVGAGDTKTYAQGFGIIVETTSTLNTYTFHR